MQKYRLPAVAGLAAQLTRGPVRLRLRQLLGVEFLLSVVDASREYPFDFVCHALTGFRPRAGDSSLDSPLLGGATLREDLVLLAEELSDGADILAEQWPEPVFTVSELAERFNVSTKTIFRWHQRGLVGWRFRYADKRVRLAFPERCVRRFVSSNCDLVTRGSSFSQLSPSEREGIIARARDLVASGEKTVNSVAKVISREVGRAVETIRLILKQYDDARPKSGIFNRSQLQVEPDDDRLAVWEAYVDGAGIETLAERFDRPVAEIYRTITQMRARELKSRPNEFIHSEEFEAENAAAEILDHPAVRNPYGERTPERRVPSDLPPYLQQLFRTPLLSPQGERALFRKMNYLKFLAEQARSAIDPDTCTAAELDRVEALLADAGAVKNQIVQSNLRLVVSIAKRHLASGQDFFELVSDGNVSLMRAVDKFDFTRGFKFSTYGSWAIMKNFARTIPEQRNFQSRYQTGREELFEGVASPPIEEHEHEELPGVRAAVERALGCLDEREQEILRQRYGLDRRGEPQTLEQIGKQLGVSKERIRQIEARAMAKLRNDLPDDIMRQLLGA